jgi:hypothetical protein
MGTIKGHIVPNAVPLGSRCPPRCLPRIENRCPCSSVCAVTLCLEVTLCLNGASHIGVIRSREGDRLVGCIHLRSEDRISGIASRAERGERKVVRLRCSLPSGFVGCSRLREGDIVLRG